MGGPHIRALQALEAITRAWDGKRPCRGRHQQQRSPWFDVSARFHSDAMRVASGLRAISADTIGTPSVITDPKV